MFGKHLYIAMSYMIFIYKDFEQKILLQCKLLRIWFYKFNLLSNVAWRFENSKSILHKCTSAKKNEHVFSKTIGSTFVFKAIVIYYQSCSPSSKPNNPIKTTGFYSLLCIRKNMLVELCVGNMQNLLAL